MKERSIVWATLVALPRKDKTGVVSAVFSFLYFKKIKISKIYVRFEIFQKYTPVALPLDDRPKVLFFFLQICNEVPGEKKGGPVAHPSGDRPLSPVGGATGLPFFPVTYFELFERVFVIIVGNISAANSYRT